MTPDAMTSDALRELMAERGWTQRDLARHTGLNEKSISEWARGDRLVPDYVGRLLQAVRLHPHLEPVARRRLRMTTAAFGRWLDAQGTQVAAAERLGVGRTSVTEWAGGIRPVPPYIVRLIQLNP